MSQLTDAERALESADEALARFDVSGLVAHLSAAIRGFTAASEPRRAALTCTRLGSAYANFMGNLTVSRAWFARAVRLVEDEPPCVEQGWVAVAAMGCDVGDPDALLASAELALDRARRFGDVNLETKARADAGLAHVQAGRVAEGMALLDEAMALACGPADDPGNAGRSACSFFTACYYTADFERAESWADLLRTHGLIGAGPGAPVFLSSHCDTIQATLLCELGRWSEAEAVLVRANEAFAAVMPGPGFHPTVGLADLRIRQGRLADAEALLLGRDHAFEALLPTARLHLARGDHALARIAAQRGLRAMAGDRLRAVQLLTVLVDAELARGDLDAARAACADLVERTAALVMPALQARTAAAQARVLAAAGDVDGAIAQLEPVVDGLDGSRSPWLRASLLIDLARLRERAGDDGAAGLDARVAAAVLATLDVVLDPDDAALLERLAPGTKVAAASHPAATARLARDGGWWEASSNGVSVRLRDTKGLRYLAELIARPGVERHALDLVDRVEGVDPSGTIDRRALGGVGELVDGRARRAYRMRIERLRAEIDDDLAAGRLDRAEARQGELDQLVAQLAQAFGLGGRSRPAASAAERARLNVTRALRAAIARLAEAVPVAGAVLDRQVRTGLYCVYAPDEGDELRWTVTSTATSTSFSRD
jgi:tetratricopeptide (TPR) repeat protein